MKILHNFFSDLGGMKLADGSVSFKANANGLVVVFDKNESFESICEQISRRLESGGFFFQTRYLAISYKGRKLTSEEEGAISRLMADKTGARTVLFEIDKDFERELRRSETSFSDNKIESPDDGNSRSILSTDSNAYTDASTSVGADTGAGVGAGAGAVAATVSKTTAAVRRSYSQIDLDECITKYYRGTMRSGKLISYDGNVVVIGDINPGAEVEATGNIIVLGNVRGIVHAGAGGNKNASVIALNFTPTQLRIADVITRKAERVCGAKTGHIPEIAYLKGDAIIIEPLASMR